ncbi:hypothetical protein GA0070622_0060 [Micromonospora sediminicola]|uniref:Uncharacterized protein n=1 Tax=Micromonospora sediminicola TaxID=946078 RepID=A0A1A9B267_9ACTN|nr:hypothetical protein [Micromonospora sediminicola]SBT63107.1 hypothetical protein GA0070622_0048 [Micromonospora sediminicola]SBT63119.1 hypothetical protein GA0070622_0060 [Micromonospora sediminicola]
MYEVTGRRWRRPARRCPEWCAQDHQCTARQGYPSGEHRSDTMTWRTRYGRLTAVRTEGMTGVGWLDIRVAVRLPADVVDAQRQASRLAVQVDLAIREVVGVVDQVSTQRQVRA